MSATTLAQTRRPTGFDVGNNDSWRGLWPLSFEGAPPRLLTQSVRVTSVHSARPEHAGLSVASAEFRLPSGVFPGDVVHNERIERRISIVTCHTAVIAPVPERVETHVRVLLLVDLSEESS